jgi:opacity protein-like surface antigen
MSLRASLLALVMTGAGALGAPAADLYGSLKDEPVMHRSAGGACYVRGDVGYVWNEDADGRYGITGDDQLTDESVENAWVVEAGVGCGSSRGFRGDVTLGYHTDREFVGLDADDREAFVGEFSSWTAMLNAYYDIGQWGAFVPYVGAGVGVAWNEIGEVTYEGWTLGGDEDAELAWALMAGVGYKLSPGVTIDVGYRYMDLGELSSDRVIDDLNWRPELEVEDLSSHEAKVGLRYSFGSLF